MNQLNSNLLYSDEISDLFDFTPANKNSVRGSYNPMQFVLRLREDIHKIMKNLPEGEYDMSDLDFNQIQAFSTFFHENIHWWQHVGSNFGFISSLKFPAQTHVTRSDLLHLISADQAYKSILKHNRINSFKTGRQDNPYVNRILNNWHDIYWAGSFTFDPKRSVERMVNNEYFLNIGHSFQMLWTSSIYALASTFDQKMSFLPNIRAWEEKFRLLRENKIEGFYDGSRIGMPPFGTKAIFEGQARFNQLQYLYLALNKKFDFSNFRKLGMMDGIYVEAFNFYLNFLEEDMPKTPDHPLIALFLLICDISINPTEGFPCDILHFESFIISNDPGIRFCLLCDAIKSKHPELKFAILNYSKEDYIEVSELLCTEIYCVSPHLGTSLVNQWISDRIEIQSLLNEEKSFQYIPSNLPIRVFFSKFLRFQEDKFDYPHFFCWPGVCFTNQKRTNLPLTQVLEIFNKHRALFINDIDENIYPMIIKGCKESNILNTFQDFFVWNSNYDMTRKWIMEEGPFTYNYEWISNKHTKTEMKEWICHNFKLSFNIHPDNIKIL